MALDDDAYNARVIDRGKLKANMLSVLTRHYQQRHELRVDGKCGPITRAHLDAFGRIDRNIMQAALSVALTEIGNGEQTNNRGPDIYRYRRGDGTKKPWNNAKSWCASFLSYCFMQAAEECGVQLPFPTSRGAKDLANKIEHAGRRILVPEPGAVIAWQRGTTLKDRWKGHVGIIYEYFPANDHLVTIEGNKRKKGEKLAYVNYFHYPASTWRKKLFKLVTL